MMRKLHRFLGIPAAALAAYDQAKADPDQHSRPLIEVLRELDARPDYALAPLVSQPV